MFSISCRKDTALKIEQPVDPYLLQQAKNWHRQQLGLASSTNPGTIDLKAYTPDWNKANMVKNVDGQDVIGVPLFSSPKLYIELNVLTQKGKNYGIVKQYILNKEQLNVYRNGGRFMESRHYASQSFTSSPYFKTLSAPISLPPEDDPTDPDPHPPILGGELPEVPVTAPPAEHPFDPNEHSVHFPSAPIGGHDFDFPHGGGKWRCTWSNTSRTSTKSRCCE